MVDSQARQAVLVVHGIGEQRPMSTLGGYIDGIVEDHDLVFAAPDRISAQPDLKRMKVTWLPLIDAATDGSTSCPPVTTDFYELYWASIMQGSELRHVTGWLATLLPRWRSLGSRFSRFLRYHFGYAALAVLAALILFTLSFVVPDAYVVRSALRWLSGLALSAASGWIVWHLGDVPRYLHNVAGNVAIQRAVRREGVALLRTMHDKTYTGGSRPLYNRIVVVGHSLGSVVAYDILRDYWTEVNRFYGVAPSSPPALRGLADAVDIEGERLWARGSSPPPPGDTGFSGFQALQRRLSSRWHELRSNPPGDERPTRWAVTDLVTLASPLTHADFLLASDGAAIAQAQWDRRLASCPPRRQLDRATYRFRYVRGRVGTESWHHAAPFACTRWTNVYYSSDVVGGPLQPLFGPGIVDIELAQPGGHAGRMPRVHSLYDRTPEALGVLRRVIWDGGTRASAASILELQRQSLRSVLSELVVTSPGDLAAAVCTAPLLRLLDAEQQRQVMQVVARLQSADEDNLVAAVDSAVELLPADLIQRVRVGSSALWSAAMRSDEELPPRDKERREEEEEEETAEAEDWPEDGPVRKR